MPLAGTLRSLVQNAGNSGYPWTHLWQRGERVLRENRPPIALFGDQKIPIVGIYHRLKAVIVAPTQMVLDYRKDHGDLFTVRIPFKFDLTYFLTKEGYAAIMGLSPDEGRIGQVFLNIPCVGSSFPRSDMSADYVQALVMAAKSFMANEILDKPTLDALPAVMRRTVDEHVGRWGSSVDLSTDFVSLVFDASARACVGDALWDRIRHEAKPLFRQIVDGIDIPRAAFNTMPIRVFGKEYRASRKLHRLLVDVRREHERTGAYPLFDRIALTDLPDGRRLPSEDVPWMLMYILWNSLAYPGSYGTWALADVLSHERACAYAASLPPTERRRFYSECFDETARLAPVASVIRVIKSPLEFEHEGTKYTIPAGDYVGAFPYVLCRDPKSYEDANVYDPFRYERGEKKPPLFGRGAFGCPARQYMRVFSAHLYDALFARVSLRLLEEPEARQCRVHLTYPKRSIRAEVGLPLERRTRDSVAPASA